MKTSIILFCSVILLPILVITGATINLNLKATNYLAHQASKKRTKIDLSNELKSIKYVVADSEINLEIVVNEKLKATIHDDGYNFDNVNIVARGDTLFFKHEKKENYNYSKIKIELNDLQYLKTFGEFDLNIDTLNSLTIDINQVTLKDLTNDYNGNGHTISFKKINSLVVNAYYTQLNINTNTRKSPGGEDMAYNKDYFDYDLIAQANSLTINGQYLNCTITDVVAKNNQYNLDTNSSISFGKHAIQNIVK